MKIDDQKIILLHPGKTGGTSIEHTLRDLYLPGLKLEPKVSDRKIMFGFDKEHQCYLQHADLRLYSILGIPYKEYKTICTVRNPYTRLLSCYYYNGKNNQFEFEDFVLNRIPNMFTNMNTAKYSSGHFFPQYYHANDVNEIIKLENFNSDCKKVGLDVKYHYSKTTGMKKHTKPMDAYTTKMKDIIYSLYKEDFRLLDYKR